MDIFVTDFGAVNAGPKFRTVLATLEPELALSKRTTRYKTAKAKMERLEQAVSTLALVEWQSGGVLRKTP